jgi:organic hydroperoxide reductase OsmC/OhrA
MQPFPHHYRVGAVADAEAVTVKAPHVPAISSAPPIEFGGSGDQWSPEYLLVAAVVDCFVLTFRAIAEKSALPWQELQCDGTGTLDRVHGTVCFSAMALTARLTLPSGGDVERARRLLEKAERTCIIANSLAMNTTLTCNVRTA